MEKAETLVVAVSGGVDSVVLLDKLVRAGEARLIVAHFDHGIRPESAEDARFVRALADLYAVPFELGEGRLGAAASEADARAARYTFLLDVMQQHSAVAILTAHQQNDRIETAVINLQRGTGRRGLSSLRDGAMLRRPLLEVSKDDVLAYAMKHRLEWVQDNSNASDRYLRNRIRKQLFAARNAAARQRFLQVLDVAAMQNDQLDELLETVLAIHAPGCIMQREWFGGLEAAVAREVLAAWLRRCGVGGYDAPGLTRMVTALQTLETGKRTDVAGGWSIQVWRHGLELLHSR